MTEINRLNRNCQITNPVKCILACLLVFYSCLSLNAQKAGIKGVVTDSSVVKHLQYAIVAILSKEDSTLVTTARSSVKGTFLVDKLKAGKYFAMITYPNMADFITELNLTDTGIADMGKIVMTSRYHLLQEVIVQSGRAIRMKGDTLEFRADSFKVADGANVEELLRRLPGIEIGKDGKIRAQGKDVTKVLVDGDEFFSDDPTLATQYLQAKSVDKVQVFDKKSDQAVFSGVDDGVRNKTINIQLKENSKNGMFGKISPGTDGKSFYNNEGMFNMFRGKEKISVFGIVSNTGTTGLSGQDKSQYITNINNQIEDETGRLIGSNIENSERYYGSGLPSSVYGGAQYANKWLDNKRNINFNYRLNRLQTNGWQNNINSQLLPDSSLRLGRSNNASASYSMQHLITGYYDLVLDSFSTMKISVQGQKQNRTGETESYSESKDSYGKLLNKSTQLNQANGQNNYFNSSMMFQHRFRKKGRNIALILLQSYTGGESEKKTEALSFYYNTVTQNATEDSLNQKQLNKLRTSSVAARVTYTEPIGRDLYLTAEYSWRHTNSDKEREVLNKGAGGNYDKLIDTLSNSYTYNITTQLPGLTLRYNPKKLILSAGGKLGFTSFEQINRDIHTSTKRQFVNLFPQVQANYNFSSTKTLSFNYYGRTEQPSIEQLQPLRENSNPLSITIGNPDLQPSFSHRMNLNFNDFRMAAYSSLNINLSWSQTQNSIIGSQTIDQFNKSTTQYINRNGLPGFFGYIGYSRRLGKVSVNASTTIGFNVNINSYGYIRMLNGTEIKTRQHSISAGPRISFYKLKQISFSYNSNISFTKSNSDGGNIGNNYNWQHNHNANATVFLPGKIELASDVTMNFQPANSSFSTSRQQIKWDASVTKKFLKNDKAQIRLAISDILNQNTGYYRNASGGMISESASNYLPRYALLSLTWNFSRTL